MANVSAQIVEYKKWAVQAKPYHIGYRDEFLGRYYATLRLFDLKLTPQKIMFGGFRLVSACVIATVPVVLKIAQERIAPKAADIPWKFALLAAVGTAALAFYNRGYDFIVRAARYRTEVIEQENSVSVLATNAIDRLSNADLTNLTEDDKGKIVRDILAAIRYQARIIIGNFNEHYLEVTLLLFENSACKHMFISERALRVRSIGSKILANRTMAYYVSKTGVELALHDFLGSHPFKKEGISDKNTKYRSILFIPIIRRMPNNRQRCFGVVTIDSERPYEFWGDKQRRLVIRIQPYLNLLRMILADAYFLESAGE